MPELLTRDQVAAYLQVKPRQIDRLGIPCINFGKKSRRYLKTDLLQCIARHREGSAA